VSRFRRFLRGLARCLVAVGLLSVVAAGVLLVWLSFTQVSAADLPPLKDGDIVFQYSGSAQSLPILLASLSAYTHMGIVAGVASGRPTVVEASSPVKETPLDRWIARGVGGRITVKRFHGLTAEQAQSVLRDARKYLGLPYDIFFLDGKDAIYCSELVHLAYQEGAGLSLGTVQKVKELHLNYAPIRKLIEARWKKYPLCRDGRKSSFEDCYRTILEQTLVTPASIARDSRLEAVFTNFGVAAE